MGVCKLLRPGAGRVSKYVKGALETTVAAHQNLI